MTDDKGGESSLRHSHVFLGEGHEQGERRTWAVIWLCGAMMVAEIVGGRKPHDRGVNGPKKSPPEERNGGP